MGLMSCAPAYYALVAEAQIDAGVRRGLPADVARGSSSSARWAGPRRCCSTAAATRSPCAATSPRPGGSTARGLDALERGNVRTAFSDALDAVLDGGR